VASEESLRVAGVTVAETDRGGDITYHGPGQLVVYPVIDLNHVRLGLHDYIRLLEAAAIDCCDAFGVRAERDPTATGVWVPRPAEHGQEAHPAKICAMGVRVRRWISLHGLALNVTTNLEHFSLIVPCGLVGRPVTSLQRELGPDCPSMDTVKSAMVAALGEHLLRALHAAEHARAGTGP
jgi:lipoyl(octanoyl) transferase